MRYSSWHDSLKWIADKLWLLVLICFAYVAQGIEPFVLWYMLRKQKKKKRSEHHSPARTASQNTPIIETSFTPLDDSTPDDTSTANG
jgi:hypothetical protein